jgi:two-component system sensor histidine kinase KdpD
VENAIKYSPPKSAIEIAVEPSLRGVEIAVRDQGPGFPIGTEAKVFDRFFRAEVPAGKGAAPAATRGAGLGLSIAKAIALVHGGEMAAMTRARGGAIVTCTLPPEAAAAAPPSEDAVPAPAVTPSPAPATDQAAP